MQNLTKFFSSEKIHASRANVYTYKYIHNSDIYRKRKMQELWTGVCNVGENLIGGEACACFNFIIKLQKKCYDFQ